MTEKQPSMYEGHEAFAPQLHAERVKTTTELRALLDVLKSPDSGISPEVFRQNIEQAWMKAMRLEDINRMLGEDSNQSVG